MLNRDILHHVHKEGFNEGERQIEVNMQAIVAKAQNGVFETAISSNIGRFQQMINVAQKPVYAG